MALQSRSFFKALWITLFKPARTNYDDVWDSHFNLTDDDITDISTSNTTTSNSLHPDGAGGVEWVPDSTGSNDKVKISATDTTEGYLDDKFDVGDEFTKETENPAANENLLIKFKGWIFNAARTFKTIISSSGITADRTATMPDASGLMAIAGMLEEFNFGGQAHGGSYTKTFTASATFDADDGNNQRMVCTGDSTLAMSNESPGVFIIDLPISGSGVSTITIGASFGQAYPNNDSLAYTDGSINTITLLVNPNGDKRYTITAYEA
jgi:hypothetical protein